MSYTKRAKDTEDYGGHQTAQTYAAIAQAEALERIATALEQIAEQGKPVEAGYLNIRTGGET